MLIYIILQFTISIGLAIFVSRKVFEYDVSVIKRNKIILTSIALFFLIFAVFSSQIAPKVAKYVFMNDIENAMMKNPMFVGLKQYDAQLYQTILDETSNSFDQGLVQKDMLANISAITSNLFFSKLPTADDDLIIEYTKLTIQKVKYLQTKSGDLCFDVLFPSTEVVTDDSQFQQDLIDKEVAIFNQLLKRPNQNNKALIEEPLFLLLAPIYEKLNETYESELISLENPNSSGLNKTKTCDMIVELYTEIMKLPTPEAGAVLRFLLK